MKKNRVRCLGIDPSIQSLGYAVITAYPDGSCPNIEEMGVIFPHRDSKAGTLDRCRAMIETLHIFFEQRLEGFGKIDYIAIENQRQFKHNNSDSCLKLAQVVGAIIWLAFDLGIPSAYVNPQTWTKGRNKTENHKILCETFCMDPTEWPFIQKLTAKSKLDAIDAVGIAHHVIKKRGKDS